MIDQKTFKAISKGSDIPTIGLKNAFEIMMSSERIVLNDVRFLAGHGVGIFAALAKVKNVQVDQVVGLLANGHVYTSDITRAFEHMVSPEGEYNKFYIKIK